MMDFVDAIAWALLLRKLCLLSVLSSVVLVVVEVAV